LLHLVGDLLHCNCRYTNLTTLRKHSCNCRLYSFIHSLWRTHSLCNRSVSQPCWWKCDAAYICVRVPTFRKRFLHTFSG